VHIPKVTAFEQRKKSIGPLLTKTKSKLTLESNVTKIKPLVERIQKKVATEERGSL
jgi:hypothetical protein